MTAPTFIDLFSGCGGFTLGMLRAGFECKAAIDFNAQAIATLRDNLQAKAPTKLPPVGFALEADLTALSPDTLAAIIGTSTVDVIVGGPPCQGFSTARQRDGSNHGTERLKDDPRRHLYRQFLNHVEHFQPKVFIIENVLGLRTAAGGHYFTAVQKEARALGYRVHAQIEDAWELGVPQKRRRQLIVAVRTNLPGYFVSDLKPATRARKGTQLGDAIMDLPVLRAGGGSDEREYDYERRKDFLQTRGTTGQNYLFNVLEVTDASALTNHVARPHSERDLRDFALISEGQSSAELMRRGVQFEFPYDKSTFKDRYTRQHRDRPCSTIVAHLSKDGLMFIHPTQNRSLTPREAARIQSFPDWFRLPGPRTHAFRLVGNAVPPLIAESVGIAVRDFLASVAAQSQRVKLEKGNNRLHQQPQPDNRPIDRDAAHAPSRVEAARELEKLASLDRVALRALPKTDFLRGWHALLFLFSKLHPDNARDHGNDVEQINPDQLALPGFEKIAARCYARTGWPVALELIGREAWRRYAAREFTVKEFYCANTHSVSPEVGSRPNVLS